MNGSITMHKATYGDLEDALLALGYTVTTGVGEYGAHYRSYDNVEHDAWVVVPDAPKEKRAHAFHLMAAENNVVWKGIADTETFHKLLYKDEAGVQAQAS